MEKFDGLISGIPIASFFSEIVSPSEMLRDKFDITSEDAVRLACFSLYDLYLLSQRLSFHCTISAALAEKVFKHVDSRLNAQEQSLFAYDMQYRYEYACKLMEVFSSYAVQLEEVTLQAAKQESTRIQFLQ